MHTSTPFPHSLPPPAFSSLYDPSLSSLDDLVGSYLIIKTHPMPAHLYLDPDKEYSSRALLATVTARTPPVLDKDIGYTYLPSSITYLSEWRAGKQSIIRDAKACIDKKILCQPELTFLPSWIVQGPIDDKKSNYCRADVYEEVHIKDIQFGANIISSNQFF